MSTLNTLNPISFFAPHLAVKNVLNALNFYQAAFGAVESGRCSNPDGSVHVAEMSIEGALFHLHEEVPAKGELSPVTLNATSCLIGFFTPDPDTMFQRAIAAGGVVRSPMQDYDYGYRQGIIQDPEGHQWLYQKRI